MNSRIEQLRESGANVSWYDRAVLQSKRNQSRDEMKQGECNYLSARLVEYKDGRATIFTVSGGKKYLPVRVESTRKSGPPVFWCTACGLIAATWSEYEDHLDLDNGTTDSSLETQDKS